jgi:hypothetical protein
MGKRISALRKRCVGIVIHIQISILDLSLAA